MLLTFYFKSRKISIRYSARLVSDLPVISAGKRPLTSWFIVFFTVIQASNGFDVKLWPVDDNLAANTITGSFDVTGFLEPFVNSGCFVHLTSFNSTIDLVNLPFHPVVVRSVLPVLYISSWSFLGQTGYTEHQTWISKGINCNQENDSLISVANCSHPAYVHSGLAAGYQRYLIRPLGIYTNLDFFKFASNARPWRCETRVGLFPPRHIFQDTEHKMSYPQIWYSGYELNLGFSGFPSTIPNFNVFVLTREQFHNHLALQKPFLRLARAFIDFKNNLVGRVPATPDVLLIAETTLKANQFGDSVQTVHSIVPIQINLNSYYNLQGSPIVLILSTKLLWRVHIWCRQSLNAITQYLLTVPENDGTLLEIVSIGFGDDQNVGKFFTHCRADSRWPLEFHSATELDSSATVHLWLTIMGNTSFDITRMNFDGKSFHWRQCNQGKVVKRWVTARVFPLTTLKLSISRKLHMITLQYYFLSLSNDMFALRFVSCGRAKMSALAFHELIRVFDMYTWTLIFASYAAFFMYKRMIIDVQKVSFHSGVKDILEYLKVILNQGEASLSNIAHLKWRLPFALLLLCSLITSNAYLNDNVYSMVKARVPIPFKFFSQLVDNSFNIYLRTTDLDYNFEDFPATGIDKKRSRVFEHMISLRDKNGFLLTTFWSELSRIQMASITSKISPRDKSKIEFIMENSRLPPNLLDVFEETGHAFLKWLARPSKKTPPSFFKNQQKSFEQLLEKCDKVAIIFPDYLCKLVASRMRSVDNVYVGKEALVESVIVFELTGVVPFYIFDRAKKVEMAGMWQRWRKLVENKLSTYRDPAARSRHPSGELAKPTMGGNMVVIFSSLFIGQAFAIICLGMESVKILWVMCERRHRMRSDEVVLMHAIPS